MDVRRILKEAFRLTWNEIQRAAKTIVQRAIGLGLLILAGVTVIRFDQEWLSVAAVLVFLAGVFSVHYVSLPSKLHFAQAGKVEELEKSVELRRVFSEDGEALRAFTAQGHEMLRRRVYSLEDMSEWSGNFQRWKNEVLEILNRIDVSEGYSFDYFGMSVSTDENAPLETRIYAENFRELLSKVDKLRMITSRVLTAASEGRPYREVVSR